MDNNIKIQFSNEMWITINYFLLHQRRFIPHVLVFRGIHVVCQAILVPVDTTFTR